MHTTPRSFVRSFVRSLSLLLTYFTLLSSCTILAKPQVLLVGQYSVGKTSFIRYLLGRDFPGQRIGPEPTTDRFTVLLNGPEERTIPGNALSVHPELPFRGLERFGVSFLSRLEGSQLPSSVLRSITLIDTPGILSGEKQRTNRGYDFTRVVAWFAEKADLIILLFDAHKLDISDELKGAIDVLKGHEDKIRCILNKADQIDRQQLMRVYGALLWSLGKTMSSPEVARVYVGSFWHEPLKNLDNAELFEMEEKDLMKDLAILPRQSAVRKINELVKRIRKVKTLAYIIGHLKSQMPAMMGKEKKQKKLINDLPTVFRTILKKHNLAPGDFPDINAFSAKLTETKFTDFAAFSQKQIDALDQVLNEDIPKLMEVCCILALTIVPFHIVIRGAQSCFSFICLLGSMCPTATPQRKRFARNAPRQNGKSIKWYCHGAHSIRRGQIWEKRGIVRKQSLWLWCRRRRSILVRLVAK